MGLGFVIRVLWVLGFICDEFVCLESKFGVCDIVSLQFDGLRYVSLVFVVWRFLISKSIDSGFANCRFRVQEEFIELISHVLRPSVLTTTLYNLINSNDQYNKTKVFK